MTDAKTLAYINMFAVLGSLENLCKLDEQAKNILSGTKPVSIGFDVKDGPKATLNFEDGECLLTEGCSDCDIRLPFSSPEKFNGLIDQGIFQNRLSSQVFCPADESPERSAAAH